MFLYLSVADKYTVYSPWNIALVLFMLVAIYPCSLQCTVLDRRLNVFNSHITYKVVNPVYRCTIHHHCLGDI